MKSLLKRITIIKHLCLLSYFSVLKTIWVNFRFLPFRQAVRLPILIKRRVAFSVPGKLEITGAISFGMIQLGRGYSGMFHERSRRSIVRIRGTMVLEGRFLLDTGASIFVSKGAFLRLGDYVRIGADSLLVCHHHIEIGAETRVVWACQIYDTSFHFIQQDSDARILPLVAPIHIGRYNWIANGTTINKGTKTPDYMIVSSGSLLNKDYTTFVAPRSMLAGKPAKCIQTGVTRIFDEREEMKINEVMYSKGQEVTGLTWHQLVNLIE